MSLPLDILLLFLLFDPRLHLNNFLRTGPSKLGIAECEGNGIAEEELAHQQQKESNHVHLSAFFGKIAPREGLYAYFGICANTNKNIKQGKAGRGEVVM